MAYANDHVWTEAEVIGWAEDLKNQRICVLCDKGLKDGGVEYNGIVLCSEACKAEYKRLQARGVITRRA